MPAHSSFLDVGAATRHLVQRSIANYTVLFAPYFSWEEACRVARERYMDSVTRHAPEQLEEMRQLAEGAEVSLDTILCINARTELLAVGKARKMASKTMAECTTVARGHLLAQNWDWMAAQKESIVIVDLEASGGRARVVTLTEGGLLCKMGMNEYGLAVALNLIESTGDGRAGGSGVPVHLLLRRVLSQCRTTEEVIAMIRNTPLDASSCFTILDGSQMMRVVELSPLGVFVEEPTDGCVAHSNHFTTGREAQLSVPAANSVLRCERAKRLVGQLDDSCDEKTLRRLLSDHSTDPLAPIDCLCKHHPDGVTTLAVLVFDTRIRACHICPARPCTDVPFQTFDMRN